MKRTVRIATAVVAVTLVLGAWNHPLARAGQDLVMGEYEGTYSPSGQPAQKAEAKVIGEAERKYRAVLTALAADGKPAEPIELRVRVPGRILSIFRGKTPRISGKVGGSKWKGTIENGKLMAATKSKSPDRFSLARIVRHSPNEGLKPPEGAIALLPFEPGKETRLDEWTNKKWDILDDGSVAVRSGDNRSVRKFGDCRLHVEFMTPYEPEHRGQGRGNSGVYLQDLFEVQVLDSFGLTPRDNECGGIYSIAAPKTNACFPPEQWQTYDITFHAPRFDADGKVVKPAVMSVLHNGVEIHKDQEVPRCTEGTRKLVKTGPIRLQDHGNPVRYRNIWIVELKD